MNLEKQIAHVIKKEADRAISNYHAYHNSLHISHERNIQRLGHSAPNKVIHQPDQWALDKKFNPFYVRKKYKSIAKSIANNIHNRTYSPNQPFVKSVPKKGGGVRSVATYQIPDAAVSKLFYERLLSKNKHRFSAFSYAYRNDRNIHFAIQDISVDLEKNERTFLAEFDFSDFFGSISHDYLQEQFSKNGFFISAEERFVIRSFLKTRKKGIPQGTSISLFLANLTCWMLDQKLELEGVKFSRYADDTIIWSQSYEKICNAFSLMHEFSLATNVPINFKKSEGISVLIKDGLPAEMSSKTEVEFLGYKLSVNEVSIKDESILKIKKEISYILYRNLIQPLKQKTLAGQAIPANDMDKNFLVAISQVRRYMYGGLTKKQIKDYLSGRRNKLYFKGIMSFYPLVTNERQLLELDGWLLSVIYRTLKKRERLLLSWKYNRSYMFPFNQTREGLLYSCSKVRINNKKLLEIPSFFLIKKALSKGLEESGIEKVMNPESLFYDYE